MIFNTSSLFVNVFTEVGMQIDNWQNAALGNWSIAGYLIGAVIAIILGARGVKLKYLLPSDFFYWVFRPCSCISRYRPQAFMNA